MSTYHSPRGPAEDATYWSPGPKFRPASFFRWLNQGLPLDKPTVYKYGSITVRVDDDWDGGRVDISEVEISDWGLDFRMLPLGLYRLRDIYMQMIEDYGIVAIWPDGRAEYMSGRIVLQE